MCHTFPYLCIFVLYYFPWIADQESLISNNFFIFSKTFSLVLTHLTALYTSNFATSLYLVTCIYCILL